MEIKISCSFELRPIEKVIPYHANVKKHPAKQVDKLASMITEYGWDQPIVVDEKSVIIKGHCRLEAAKKLGLKEVPVIVRSDLSKAQVKAARIADNKIAESEWDIDNLVLELNELDDMEFNADLTGFDEDERDKLIPTRLEYEGNTDPDDIPEEVETRCKPGDLWELGGHRLLCGDSTNIQQVERLMNGEKADMVFTDPPYGMFLDTDYDSMFAADTKHRKTGKRFDKVAGDHEDFNPEFINIIFAAFPDTKEVFLWGADYYSELLPERKQGSWVVWDKRCNEQMDKVSGNTFELCWSKAKHKRLIARLMWSGHHGMQKDDVKTRVHPTQKPVALAEWFFEQWGSKGDLVADLFLGSGSTLIACEKTNRKCYGMEIDPHYIDVAIERWEKFTGKKAVLLSV